MSGNIHILDRIVATKKKELAESHSNHRIDDLEKKGFLLQKKNRSLVKNLNENNGTGIIAEFKRKSPSKGWFNKIDISVQTVIPFYCEFGASGISVLTDEEYFGGSLEDLKEANEISTVPLLRKDFIIDQLQIAEAKACGADVILLIAACLERDQVKELARYAKGLGLEVLLELHDESELDHISDDIDLVGINNRDLRTFEVNINTSLRMIKLLPKERPAIAESGITDAKTMVILKEAGFRGFLIGESFMKQKDPGMAFRDFTIRYENASR